MTTPRRSPRARSRIVMIGLALAVSIGASLPAFAEGWAYDLAGELMSPYCPGRTLSSCPSPQAAELVQWISLQEASGTSEDEVIDMLVDRFGEEILGAPPAEGITLWAYVFPVAGFVLFGGVAFLALRRIVSTGDAPADVALPGTESGGSEARSVPAANVATGDATEADADLARRVDAELAARLG